MSCETIIKSDKVFELVESKNQTLIIEKQVETETFIDVQIQIIEEKKQNQAITEFITAIPEHSHGSPIRVVETTQVTIAKGIPHTLPDGLTYTLDPSGHGRNLWIKVDGQDLVPNSNGTPRDYQETSKQQVTFNRSVAAGSNIIYTFFN